MHLRLFAKRRHFPESMDTETGEGSFVRCSEAMTGLVMLLLDRSVGVESRVLSTIFLGDGEDIKAGILLSSTSY